MALRQDAYTVPGHLLPWKGAVQWARGQGRQAPAGPPVASPVHSPAHQHNPPFPFLGRCFHVHDLDACGCIFGFNFLFFQLGARCFHPLLKQSLESFLPVRGTDVGHHIGGAVQTGLLVGRSTPQSSGAFLPPSQSCSSRKKKSCGCPEGWFFCLCLCVMGA